MKLCVWAPISKFSIYWQCLADKETEAEGWCCRSQKQKASWVNVLPAVARQEQVDFVNSQVLSRQQTDQIVAQARSNPHHVVQLMPRRRHLPPAPFTTSSLQQAAGSRLKYGSEDEGSPSSIRTGLYHMRTDSVALSEDYCLQARQWLQQHDPKMCQSGGYREVKLD